MTSIMNTNEFRFKKDNELTMFCSKNNENLTFEYADGIIYDDMNQIVCTGLNKIKRIDINKISFNEIQDLNFIKNNEFKFLKKHLMIDGTIIKLYWYNNQWRKSTNKVIDAYKSRWENKKSFGEMFDEVAFDLNYNILDTELNYYFIMQHPENRIIEKINEPKLFFIGAFDLSGREFNVEINVKKQQEINFSSLQDIYNFLKSGSLQLESPGIVLSSDNISFRIFLENPNYLKIKNIKNTMPFNTKKWMIKPTINQKTCRLVKIIIEKQDNQYIKSFPEERNEILVLKQKIESIITEAFLTYQKCCMYKTERYDKTHKYFSLLQKIHKEYMETKQNITREKVKEIFYKQSMTLILSLLEVIDFKN